MVGRRERTWLSSTPSGKLLIRSSPSSDADFCRFEFDSSIVGSTLAIQSYGGKVMSSERKTEDTNLKKES